MVEGLIAVSRNVSTTTRCWFKFQANLTSDIPSQVVKSRVILPFEVFEDLVQLPICHSKPLSRVVQATIRCCMNQHLFDMPLPCIVQTYQYWYQYKNSRSLIPRFYPSCHVLVSLCQEKWKRLAGRMVMLWTHGLRFSCVLVTLYVLTTAICNVHVQAKCNY